MRSFYTNENHGESKDYVNPTQCQVPIVDRKKCHHCRERAFNVGGLLELKGIADLIHLGLEREQVENTRCTAECSLLPDSQNGIDDESRGAELWIGCMWTKGEVEGLNYSCRI